MQGVSPRTLGHDVLLVVGLRSLHRLKTKVIFELPGLEAGKEGKRPEAQPHGLLTMSRGEGRDEGHSWRKEKEWALLGG